MRKLTWARIDSAISQVKKRKFVGRLGQARKGRVKVVGAIDWESKEVLDRLESYGCIIPDVVAPDPTDT